jgi:trimeric autotransporter adhesin
MTPNKQVSPVIRISQGERDASARATHLEAATRKFLVTTNERKQMSTTTNFKRIALVAVAALGLGVLSSAPSQAAPVGLSGSAMTLSTTAGAPTLSKSDSTTAATVSASVLVTTAGESLTLSSTGRIKPASAASFPAVYFMLVDTVGSTSKTVVQTSGTLGGTAAEGAAGGRSAPGTLTETGTIASIMPAAGSSNAYVSAKFFAIMESITTTRVAGTYTYTVLASMYLGNAISTTHSTQTIDISFVVPAAAEDSTTIVPGSSTAFLASTEALATADAAVSALATASSTAAAVLRVKTFNTVAAAPESITVTISGAGILSFGGISGASLVVQGDGDTPINILPDGRSGVATIAVSTTTRQFANKSMTFYAVAPATLVASVPTPNLALGSNSDTVRVIAKDAAGVSWAGAVYLYASTAADALIAGSNATPTLCTWDAADDRHECSVTGTAAGTAKLKAINASTVAAATVTSNEVSAVVNTNSAASVKLSFDKATYAPGEKAYIYVTPLDSAGKEIAKVTLANLLASGGITTNSALSFTGSTTTSESLTATVSYSADANSSSTSGAKAGSFRYTVYMPVSGGTVTISATGGTSLPIAARVVTTATATVNDSGAAALAAVTALATQVASLRTLITTLTNLVLKIQKKVKA